MSRMLGFTLILIAVAASALAQGKIIVDPNISGLPNVTAPEAQTTGDERLARKISYEGGYKRLHTVVSDLSKASGVRLYCGTNSKDWQVQDIPVVVYAKDMPLGKLLRAVADGTHTLLTTLTVGAKEKEPTYTICRNKKTADGIVADIEGRYYAKYADAEWAWDALAAFGKTPDLDGSKIGVWASGLSRILANLSDEDKRKVFAGGSVIVNTDTAPKLGDSLRQLYADRCTPAKCTPEDLRKSEMKICLSAVGDSDLQYLCADFIHHDPSDGNVVFGGYPISVCVDHLKGVKGFDLSPRPPSELHQPKEDYHKDRLRILETPLDWELPVLKMKISLEAPKGKEHPTFADAVIAIAKASGFNIVCEDFQSHQDAKFTPSAGGFFVKETTLGEALIKLNAYRPTWLNSESGRYDPTWLINEQDKLIVGWANEWREHHYYLVPESLIVGLSKKMNGPGAQLDDIVPLVNLSRRQTSEWISHTQDIWPATWMNYTMDRAAEVSAWQPYAALSDADKAQAKTEAGLPLGKFDPGWLAGFFSKWKTLEPPYDWSDEEKQKAEAEIQLKRKFLTDPKLITTLVMRITRDYRQTMLEIFGEDNGETVRMQFPGPGRFPLYSPKREKELSEPEPKAGS